MGSGPDVPTSKAMCQGLKRWIPVQNHSRIEGKPKEAAPTTSGEVRFRYQQLCLYWGLLALVCISPCYVTSFTLPNRVRFPSLTKKVSVATLPRARRAWIPSPLHSTPSPNSDYDNETFKALLSAAALYKAAYGDLNVPSNFIVPDLAPWPAAAHGMSLGVAVAQWKEQAPSSPAQARALQQLGLIDKAIGSKRPTWSLLVTAVQVYRTETGTTVLPDDFVVPNTWAPATIRGLPLGAQLRALAKSPKFADRVAQLGISFASDVAVEAEERAQAEKLALEEAAKEEKLRTERLKAEEQAEAEELALEEAAKEEKLRTERLKAEEQAKAEKLALEEAAKEEQLRTERLKVEEATKVEKLKAEELAQAEQTVAEEKEVARARAEAKAREEAMAREEANAVADFIAKAIEESTAEEDGIPIIDLDEDLPADYPALQRKGASESAPSQPQGFGVGADDDNWLGDASDFWSSPEMLSPIGADTDSEDSDESSMEEFDEEASDFMGDATIDVPTLDSLLMDHRGRLSANDRRFYLVFSALANYKKLYGDLLVPQPFVVPSNTSRWSEELWGIRLGARVNAIRSQGTFVNNDPDRRARLDELGFVWSPPTVGDRRTRVPAGEGGGSGALDSLFGGSFDFGNVFLSSTEGSTPTSAWDLDSARIPESAARMSNEKEEAERQSEEYVPPRSLKESLDEATARAIDCGIITGFGDGKRAIKGKQEKDIPWFNDDFGDDFVFEDVVEALTIYKGIHGDFSNFTEACDFVVPAQEQLAGFLDDSRMNLYDMALPPKQPTTPPFGDTDNDEFSFSETEEDFITTEIQKLQREVEQNEPEVTNNMNPVTLRDGPIENNNEWPEHLGGMALGHIVTRIRDGSLEVKHLPERKKQLDAIDFDWGDPKRFLDIPFEKAMCSFYAYYLVRGDMCVPENFIMPAEDPWPEALAGYEIGKAVTRIRELQNFLEAYHPRKVYLLRMIDFVWFAETVALPLDADEKEMSAERIILAAFGHPDNVGIIDPPRQVMENMLAEGPYHETDDAPKLWWKKWHDWDSVEPLWYEKGRRDNALALRLKGFPDMADEHEAKYGPGLFTQIEGTLEQLEGKEIDDIQSEDRKELLGQLSYYQQELDGCRDVHPSALEILTLKIDEYAANITATFTFEEIEEFNAEMSNSDSVEEEEVNFEDEEDDDEFEEELVVGDKSVDIDGK